MLLFDFVAAVVRAAPQLPAGRTVEAEQQQFLPAGELRIGESLLLADDTTRQLLSSTLRPTRETVYNIEVDGEHVFFVGNDGVLVHNTCRNSWNQFLSDNRGRYHGKNWLRRARAEYISEMSKIRKIRNAIANGTQLKDKTGVLREMAGQGLTRPLTRGGGYWDHIKEMNNTLQGLRARSKELAGSRFAEAIKAQQEAADAIQMLERLTAGMGI